MVTLGWRFVLKWKRRFIAVCPFFVDDGSTEYNRHIFQLCHTLVEVPLFDGAQKTANTSACHVFTSSNNKSSKLAEESRSSATNWMHFFKFLTSSFPKHFSLLYYDNYVKMSLGFCIIYALKNSFILRTRCTEVLNAMPHYFKCPILVQKIDSLLQIIPENKDIEKKNEFDYQVMLNPKHFSFQDVWTRCSKQLIIDD